MKVLAMPGSLRRGSYNRKLLVAAAACAPAGMSVDVVPHEVLAAIPPFNQDVEALGDPAPVVRLRDAVRAADGLLISTPEYNQSIPGVLKNLIDWLSRPRPDEVLIGKPAAVMGATTGPWGTRLAQGMVRQVLGSTECLVMPPGVAVYVARVKQLFDQAGELTDEPTRERLGRLLAAFGEWIAQCTRS